MLRGIYIAGTGMLTQRKRMDIVANNIANANTNGYKRDKSIIESFGDVLLSRINSSASISGNNNIGNLNYGVHIDEPVSIYDQGSFEYTGEPAHFALAGRGFFAIQSADGIRYTRNGTFSRNSDGYLTTVNGSYVLGQNGPVQLPAGRLFADEYGNLFVNDIYIDTLNIAGFNDENALVKEGDLTFRYEGTGEGMEEFTGHVKQGYVEGSNVEISDEMINMMSIARNYDSNQRIFRIIDDTLSKAVNEVGSI